MVRYRLSGPAQADLIDVLAASLERWGPTARSRYAKLFAEALEAIATEPKDPATRDRTDLLRGTRSLHARHVRGEHGVRRPVHVIFYRVAEDGVIEVLRILHERMDPALHVEPE